MPTAVLYLTLGIEYTYVISTLFSSMCCCLDDSRNIESGCFISSHVNAVGTPFWNTCIVFEQPVKKPLVEWVFNLVCFVNDA